VGEEWPEECLLWPYDFDALLCVGFEYGPHVVENPPPKASSTGVDKKSLS
jgi:hypothetical protein